MAKTPRPDPLTEGCLQELYNKFFGKLIDYKPPLMSLSEWMGYLFDVSHRDVQLYIATRDFRMPGLYYRSPAIPTQGLGFRNVRQGAKLWVRTDGRDPNKVDIEFHGGQGEKEQVFQLNQTEWNRVAPLLREPNEEDKKEWRKIKRRLARQEK